MPDSGWPWAAKCFSVAMTCFLPLKLRVALKSPHRGDAELGNQVGVLAEGLLDPPPAGVARHINHRRQGLVRSARTRFLGRHRVERLDKRGIESGRQANRLGKTGRAQGGVAVETFFVKKTGMPSRLCSMKNFCMALVNSAISRPFLPFPASLGRPTWPNPWPSLKAARAFAEIEIAFAINKRVRFLLPDTEHLRGFFLKSHAGEQVFDAPFRREIWVFIVRIPRGQSPGLCSALNKSAGLVRPGCFHGHHSFVKPPADKAKVLKICRVGRRPA